MSKQPSLPEILAAQRYEHQMGITDAEATEITMKHFLHPLLSNQINASNTGVFNRIFITIQFHTCCLISYFIIKSALSLVELLGENLVKWQSAHWQ